MKKGLIFILLLCAIAFAVFAQNGIVREMSGEVELKPAGASSFTPARIGSTVAQNTIVSTGFKSTAIIEIGSSVITVLPLTRLSLSEIQASSGTENISMNLQSGRIRVDVNPPAGTRTNFEVQTPSSTASVRGTSFEMDTQNLNVLSGLVTYTNNNGLGTIVPGGLFSSIASDGQIIDPFVQASQALEPTPPLGAEVTGGATLPPASTGDITIEIQY